MVVKHSRGSYEISTMSVEEVFQKLDPEAPIITDNNLEAYYAKFLNGRKVLVLQAGEGTKNFANYQKCLEWLATQKVQRSQSIVALGGGVVGDLVGIVAATYLRGVKHIQVPTSLLAMVDSSVGGKVGIDLPQGKNLVGAFWPPSEVLLATEFLKTLPHEQVINGMAEVWKYAFIVAPELTPLLEESDRDYAKIVNLCIDLKRQTVEADEFETTGQRATLNFGHTIGHAIEQASDYQLLHGQAISIGMVLEARLGENLGITPTGTATKIQSYLQRTGLPTTQKATNPEQLLDFMRSDKKVSGSELAFALLTDLGACKLFRGISEKNVLEVLSAN
ncbi:MAG: 3-dehydroquinate synthase [Armatimonadetes bacterium]|nr:3-dehydroquinate synthase [Armatimonadota bacterium]